MFWLEALCDGEVVIVMLPGGTGVSEVVRGRGRMGMVNNVVIVVVC